MKVLEKILGGSFIAFAVIFAFAILSFLFAIPVKLLWNWLMPDIFGLPTLSYIQAWGLLVLSTFLVHSSSSASE